MRAPKVFNIYNVASLEALLQADVAKWLRQWVVVPLFAGSIPVIRLFS